jgi:L-alanine-DL-glutamate epimerase-like enolase superfamily enzyme
MGTSLRGFRVNGRRGLVINAIGALDMALHDFTWQGARKPCFEMLGVRGVKTLRPMHRCNPSSSFEAYRESMTSWALDAQRRGFGAAKLEASGPYVHKGLQIKPAQALSFFRRPSCRGT